jgi:multidrug efflux pump subunit AcrB
MISRFFIYRPIFAAVVSIVIVILGSVALVSLPISRYPSISPPTIQVSAVYPGANAVTVAETVATPIEQEINGVEGMAFMSSVSSSDGSMALTIVFEVGTDLDTANVLVQNRVSLAETRLPEEVRRQGVSVKKQSPEITLFIAFYSPDDTLDSSFLHNFVKLNIEDEIKRVPGVGDVRTFGTGEFGMRIWLDPNRLKSRGLTRETSSRRCAPRTLRWRPARSVPRRSPTSRRSSSRSTPAAGSASPSSSRASS